MASIGILLAENQQHCELGVRTCRYCSAAIKCSSFNRTIILNYCTIRISSILLSGI